MAEGFKKNVNRATTQVMMKTGMRGKFVGYRRIPANQFDQDMWRKRTTVIMKLRRGEHMSGMMERPFQLTRCQTIQNDGSGSAAITKGIQGLPGLAKR